MPASAHSRLGSRGVYGLHAMLGAAGLAATAGALAAGASSVHIMAGTGHRLVVAGQAIGYPAINVAAALLLSVAALGAVVVIVAARTAWRQVRATRSFLRGLRVAGPLEGYPGAYVFDDRAPHAFCAGYLRPRVYVSTRALELLSPPELRAVVAHEYHHRCARDPLRQLCGRVLSQALFFMPVLRLLNDRYGELAEITADAAALRATGGDKAPLASALIALGGQESDAVVGISPERVDSLLGQPHPWELPALLVLAALAAICAVIVLVWRTSGAASAHATLNLPVISSQPCVLVLGLIPAVACAAAVAARR